jgi:hypothetical protein
MLAQREPEHPPGGHVQDRGQVKLALAGLDLSAVAIPLGVELRRREVPFDQVRSVPAALPGPRRGPAPALAPGGQALLTHHRRDRVLADLPGRRAQVSGDPRRPVSAPVRSEQPPDLRGQLIPPDCPRRRGAVFVLVEPRPGHPQRPAGCRMTATSLSPPVSACRTARELASASASSDPNPSSRNSAPRRAPERLCSSTRARASAREARSWGCGLPGCGC